MIKTSAYTIFALLAAVNAVDIATQANACVSPAKDNDSAYLSQAEMGRAQAHYDAVHAAYDQAYQEQMKAEVAANAGAYDAEYVNNYLGADSSEDRLSLAQADSAACAESYGSGGTILSC